MQELAGEGQRIGVLVHHEQRGRGARLVFRRQACGAGTGRRMCCTGGIGWCRSQGAVEFLRQVKSGDLPAHLCVALHIQQQAQRCGVPRLEKRHGQPREFSHLAEHLHPVLRPRFVAHVLDHFFEHSRHGGFLVGMITPDHFRDLTDVSPCQTAHHLHPEIHWPGKAQHDRRFGGCRSRADGSSRRRYWWGRHGRLRRAGWDGRGCRGADDDLLRLRLAREEMLLGEEEKHQPAENQRANHHHRRRRAVTRGAGKVGVHRSSKKGSQAAQSLPSHGSL